MHNPCSTRLSGQAAWSGLKPVWQRQAAEFEETGVLHGACHPLTFRSPDSAQVSTSASSPGSSASQPSRPNRLLAGNLRDRNCSNPWAASSQRSTCTACRKSSSDAHAHHRVLLPCGMSCTRAKAAQKSPCSQACTAHLPLLGVGQRLPALKALLDPSHLVLLLQVLVLQGQRAAVCVGHHLNRLVQAPQVLGGAAVRLACRSGCDGNTHGNQAQRVSRMLRPHTTSQLDWCRPTATTAADAAALPSVHSHGMYWPTANSLSGSAGPCSPSSCAMKAQRSAGDAARG